jgi:hypothetical protein
MGKQRIGKISDKNKTGKVKEFVVEEKDGLNTVTDKNENLLGYLLDKDEIDRIYADDPDNEVSNKKVVTLSEIFTEEELKEMRRTPFNINKFDYDKYEGLFMSLQNGVCYINGRELTKLFKRTVLFKYLFYFAKNYNKVVELDILYKYGSGLSFSEEIKEGDKGIGVVETARRNINRLKEEISKVDEKFANGIQPYDNKYKLEYNLKDKPLLIDDKGNEIIID